MDASHNSTASERPSETTAPEGEVNRLLVKATGHIAVSPDSISCSMPLSVESFANEEDAANYHWHHEQAKDLIERALELAMTECGLKHQAQCYLDLGNVLRALGRPKDAHTAFQKAGKYHKFSEETEELKQKCADDVWRMSGRPKLVRVSDVLNDGEEKENPVCADVNSQGLLVRDAEGRLFGVMAEEPRLRRVDKTLDQRQRGTVSSLKREDAFYQE